MTLKVVRCSLPSRRVTNRRSRSLVSGPWLRLRADHNHWAHPLPAAAPARPCPGLRYLYSRTSSAAQPVSSVTAGPRIDPWCPHWHCPLSPPATLPGLLATLLQTLTVSNFSSDCVSLAEDKTLTAVKYNTLSRCHKCRRLNFVLTMLLYHITLTFDNEIKM